jgi:hypothetical protein
MEKLENNMRKFKDYVLNACPQMGWQLQTLEENSWFSIESVSGVHLDISFTNFVCGVQMYYPSARRAGITHYIDMSKANASTKFKFLLSSLSEAQ